MGALCGLGWRICQQLFQRMVWKLLEQRRLLACQLFQQRLHIQLCACFQQQQRLHLQLYACFQQQQRLCLLLRARFQQQRRLLAGKLFQQRLLSGKQLVQRLVLIPSQAFGRLEKAIIVDVARRSALEGIVSSLSQPR